MDYCKEHEVFEPTLELCAECGMNDDSDEECNSLVSVCVEGEE